MFSKSVQIFRVRKNNLKTNKRTSYLFVYTAWEFRSFQVNFNVLTPELSGKIYLAAVHKIKSHNSFKKADPLLHLLIFSKEIEVKISVPNVTVI